MLTACESMLGKELSNLGFCVAARTCNYHSVGSIELLGKDYTSLSLGGRSFSFWRTGHVQNADLRLQAIDKYLSIGLEMQE